jgi:hypothetical protein
VRRRKTPVQVPQAKKEAKDGISQIPPKEVKTEPELTKRCLLTSGFSFIKTLYNDIH